MLALRVRKFFCSNDACQQKIFVERLPKVAAAHGRRTERLSVAIGCIAFACGGEGGARLADRLGIKFCPDTFLREIRRLKSLRCQYRVS